LSNKGRRQAEVTLSGGDRFFRKKKETFCAPTQGKPTPSEKEGKSDNGTSQTGTVFRLERSGRKVVWPTTKRGALQKKISSLRKVQGRAGDSGLRNARLLSLHFDEATPAYFVGSDVRMQKAKKKKAARHEPIRPDGNKKKG